MFKKTYKSRVIIILLVFLGLYAIIIARLYLIQIHKKDFFKILANQQYDIEIVQQTPRALIYDKHNIPLALNKESFSAFIIPHQLEEKEKTKKIFKTHFPKIYKKLKKYPEKHFLWLERNLNKSKLEFIKSLNSKDIHLLKEPERFYPFKELAQVIGFTNIDNMGIAGIELQFNDRLSGKPTKLKLQKDARSGVFYFEKEITKKGKEGESVNLTIDSKLQFLVYEELKNTVKQFKALSGSVLILEPQTGQILVMCNYPSFNPNKKPIENFDITKNKVVTESYELGSVIKIFSALAALQEGVVTPDEEIDCEGKSAYIDGFKVENWRAIHDIVKGKSDIVPFHEVVRYSSNVGIAKVTKELNEKFYTYLESLGFGNKTNIRFPGERSGFVNPPSNWSRSSIIAMSFGYEIMATLLQLGRALCVISNNGYQIQPQLVSNPLRTKNTIKKKIFSSKTIKEIKDILEVIGDKYTNFPGYKVMGKTGTARSVKDGKYSKKHHVYSFGGMVEKNNYKRVIVTFINEPGNPNLWASQVTAPLFAKVVEKTIIYDLKNNNQKG